MPNHEEAARIRYSRGRDKFDNLPEQREAADFGAFEAAFLADRSRKKGQTFFCAPFEVGTHSKPDEYPGEKPWRQGHLAAPRAFLAFDCDGFDTPETFEQVRAYFARYRGFSYTTASHAPDAPRCRIVVALNRAVTREAGETLGLVLQGVVEQEIGAGRIKFDPSVYRGEQPIYTPLHAAVTFHFAGEPVDVDAILATAPPKEETPKRVEPPPRGDRCDGAAQAALRQLIGDAASRPFVDPAKPRRSQGYALGAAMREAGLAGDLIAEAAHLFVAMVPDGTHPYTQEEAVEDITGGYEKANGADGESRKQPPPQRDRLIGCVSDCEFWRDGDGDGYATVLNDRHWQNWPIRSKQFKDYVARCYYLKHQGAPSAAATEDALRVLEAKARFEGTEHATYTRIAELDGIIYFDLANPAWEVVKVTSEGWKIVADCPVKFLRPRGMKTLPHPVGVDGVDGADLLRGFLNVPDGDDFNLVVAWTIGAIAGRGPYPILELVGEQGTAKSTTARIIRECIDPNIANLRAPPRKEEDVLIAARNGWVVAYDNLSHIPPWLSDAMCRLATGGGFGTRELYTNFAEALVDVQRPTITTGVAPTATRGDLADRKITATLEVIPDDRRRSESELYAEFYTERPRILGWLLGIVAGALKELPTTRLDRLPRMADFALRVSAAERALGWKQGSFLDIYTGRRRQTSAIVVDGDPVARAITKLMATTPEWEGMASALLEKLNHLVSDDVRASETWPKGANALSGKLTRLGADLRATGIDIGHGIAGRAADSRKTIR